MSLWNIPFQLIGTVFVMQFQEISHRNELIFWEDRTLKLCRELRWENVCDCQLGICSKLHTSSQINKTACMLSPRQHTKTVSHPLDTFQHHTVSGPQNEYGNIRKQHYLTLQLFILSCWTCWFWFWNCVEKWNHAINRQQKQPGGYQKIVA